MSAFAGELTVAGSSQVGGGYTDNLLMRPNTVDATWNALVDVGGHAKYKAETFSASFDPRVTLSRYKNRKDLDHTDKLFTLQLNKFYEQFDHSLTVTGTEDTTLTSEIGLTGLTEKNRMHRAGSVNYTSKKTFNEYIDAVLQLYGTDHRYMDAVGTQLINYRYGSAALTANYNYDYRTRVFVQGLAGKYLVSNQINLPPGLDYNKKNLSALLGVSRQLDERWSFSASFGPSQIRTSQSLDRGSSYNATLAYKAELSFFSLAVNRDILPNGYGELSRTSRVRLDWLKPVSEDVNVRLSATSTRSKNLKLNSNATYDSFDYREVDASLKWAFTQTWGLSLSAGHAWQDYGSGLAKKNFAALSVTWNGLDHLLN